MDKQTTFTLLVMGALLLLGGGTIAAGVVSSMGKLSIDQIATIAHNAGFAGQDLITAVAVAMAESGGDSNALGDSGKSFGLWQIDSQYHPEFGPDFARLYDPQTNANAAFSVYATAGGSFLPWSAYKNGSYLAFVGNVQNTLNA
jgi:hypothetical protein